MIPIFIFYEKNCSFKDTLDEKQWKKEKEENFITV